jgi:phage/plasmid-associated DNA primase
MNSISLSHKHRAELKASALTDTQIDAMKWGTQANGWLVIPYLQPDGSPVSSSTGKPWQRWKPAEPGDGPRYISPKGEGCRLYHSHQAIALGQYEKRLADANVPICFTEGEKKTEAITAHWPKAITIGLGGVTSWVDRRNGESQPLPELDALELKGRRIFLLFDSDQAIKPSVRAALESFSEHLHQQGASTLIIRLPAELDGDKNGADDFIYRHGTEAFHHLVSSAQPAWLVKGKGERAEPFFNLPIDPPKPHHKALMAWAVLKDHLAIRPGMGLYSWTGTHWQGMAGRTSESLDAQLHQWMDHQCWEDRAVGLMASVRGEVQARLGRPAEQWDRPEWMAFANGTLQIPVGRFERAHHLHHTLTSCLPYPYDPGAKCPRFLAFLEQALGGDLKLIALLRAAIRWTLLPKPLDAPSEFEFVFDVKGRRGCGKGTLSEVLQAVVGGSNGTGILRSTTFSNPNALHGLIGKRLALDPDCSGRVSDPGTFNAVASNEPVSVKKMYVDCGAARLGVVIWRFMNDTPGASGGGLEGMGRRILTIPMQDRMGAKDFGLKERLCSEVAGVFSWAWSLGDDAMRDTLKAAGTIAAVMAGSIEQALEQNPHLRFLIETYPDGATVQAAALYDAWKGWCDQNGHQPGSGTTFGSRVKKVEGLGSKQTKVATFYEIPAMAAFDLAAHLGLRDEQPTTTKPNSPPPQPQPTTADPAAAQSVSRQGGDGGEFSSNSFVSKEKEEEKAHSNSFGSKPTTVTTHTTSAAPAGSMAIDALWEQQHQDRLQASVEDDPFFPLTAGVQVEFQDPVMGWRAGYTVLDKPGAEGMVRLKSPTGARLHARRKSVRHHRPG